MALQVIEEEPGIGASLRKGMTGDNNFVKAFGELMQQKNIDTKKASDLAKSNEAIKKDLNIDLTGYDPEARKIRLQGEMQERQQRNKLAGDKEEEKKSKDVTQKSFNRLSELVSDVGTVNSWLTMGGRTSESFGEFESLLGALESRLVEMVNKGTLSNTRFNYIKNDLLPTSSDSQEKIKGKLKGLALELDLDPSALQPKKKGKKQASASAPGTQGKQPLKDIWE